MSELERDLRALAATIEFPATPDLAGAVRARLERRRRWPFAVAVAAAAVAVAFAVPPARTAILRLFHVGAVHVEVVDTLPRAKERPLSADLGPSTSLAQAERRAGFRLVLPPGTPRPSRAYGFERLIAVILRGPTGRPILLIEVPNTGMIVKKLTTGGNSVENVRVNRDYGLWIAGAPHVVQVRSSRLAGNALVWTHGRLTFRLEGRLSRDQALTIARTMP